MLTYQLNVNSSGWTAIIPRTRCKSIEVSEAAQAGTDNFYVSSDQTNWNEKPAGKIFEYVYISQAHEVSESAKPVFWLKMKSGSVDFDVTEKP